MATPFRPASDLLAQYARYHRDRRNIATHFVGVPLIVFGVAVLLARPAVWVEGQQFTLAWLVFAMAAGWYVTRGHLGLGLAVSAAVGMLVALAHPLAQGSVALWLVCGLGSFGLGWMVQFLGHWYEGRKPAFADDLVGLLVGPMFVVLEVLAPSGWFKPLMAHIERVAGPTYLRDLAHPA